MRRDDIHTPPRTIMEVYKMLPEGTLAELIDGHLSISRVPGIKHQKILKNILFAIHQYVSDNNLGETLFLACDVFLDEHSNAVQPDIIFVSDENISIIKDDAIHGIPDLLIEILSPGNTQHDTIKKKELYQKFGVQEYWVINPETTESIGYALKNRIYIECGRHKAMIKSLLLNHEFSF